MDAVSFSIGVLSALATSALVLAATYWRLKSRRNKQAPIRGYLDLIPDLSEHQRTQVEEIRHDFLPKVALIRNQLRIERASLANLLFAEPTEREKIDEAAGRILRRQSELEREVVDHILQEKELLQPAQRRMFHQIIIQQFATGGLGVHDSRTGYNN